MPPSPPLRGASPPTTVLFSPPWRLRLPSASSSSPECTTSSRRIALTPQTLAQKQGAAAAEIGRRAGGLGGRRRRDFCLRVSEVQPISRASGRGDYFSALRLVLAGRDRERGSYNLKEAAASVGALEIAKNSPTPLASPTGTVLAKSGSVLLLARSRGCGGDNIDMGTRGCSGGDIDKGL